MLNSSKEGKMRIALCLRGAVSRRSGDSMTKGSIYFDNNYVNYKAVFNSISKHILNANAHHDIDIMLQSWNKDLRQVMLEMYRPIRFAFEDNRNYQEEILKRCSEYKDFSGVSQALSIRNVIDLKESYESEKSFNYDMVVLYRPDVLLWKDMILDDYDLSAGVFVNGHPGGGGDFHFIMSSEDSKSFKYLYDSPLNGNPHEVHSWIRVYREKYKGRKVIRDDFVPGLHQEVARPHKMRQESLDRHGIDPSVFLEYGMTIEDLGFPTME
jgi:hypothetical protein